jgi:hypothetical protein
MSGRQSSSLLPCITWACSNARQATGYDMMHHHSAGVYGLRSSVGGGAYTPRLSDLIFFLFCAF